MPYESISTVQRELGERLRPEPRAELELAPVAQSVAKGANGVQERANDGGSVPLGSCAGGALDGNKSGDRRIHLLVQRRLTITSQGFQLGGQLSEF